MNTIFKNLCPLKEEDYKQFDNKIDMLNHAFLCADTVEQYKAEVLTIEKLTKENN